MPEILLNKESFEQLNGRFESVFNAAENASDYACRAERKQQILFLADLNKIMLSEQSNAIRSIMGTIVQSFSDVDDENRKKAEEIRDVIIGSPGYVVFSDGSYSSGGGGYSSGGGGNGAFGGGGGGGGVRGSETSGNGFAQDVLDELRNLPNDIVEGWRTCRDVTAWYNSLPEDLRYIVDKAASSICKWIDPSGDLNTTLHLVHDVFSANTGLDAIGSIVDVFAKAGGKVLGKSVGGFAPDISFACSCLGDYATGFIESAMGVVKGDTIPGGIIHASSEYASQAIRDVLSGNWNDALTDGLLAIGSANAGCGLAVLDGIAQGSANIKNGMADAAERVFNAIGWNWGNEVIVEELRADAREDENLVNSIFNVINEGIILFSKR